MCQKVSLDDLIHVKIIYKVTFFDGQIYFCSEIIPAPNFFDEYETLADILQIEAVL